MKQYMKKNEFFAEHLGSFVHIKLHVAPTIGTRWKEADSRDFGADLGPQHGLEAWT